MLRTIRSRHLNQPLRVLPAAAIAMTVAALNISCSSDDSSATPQPRGVANPTYHQHIAPLLYDNCVSCHQNGGIAPFSFVNEQGGLDNAKQKAGSIKLDVEERIMPPWLADNSGQCNTYQHARWLSDADIETIGNWVDNGRPEGTPPATPLTIPAPPGLNDPNSTATMSEVYTPSGDPNNHPQDDYRCFLVDPGITTSDQLLTAFEMVPGNDALVHHIILFGLPNQETEDAAVALDNATPGPGYTCFGDSGVQASGAVQDPPFLAGWAPGTKLTEYPQGTGVLIKAGRKMIMQVHYNLANANQAASTTDQTGIKLKYSPVGGNIQEALVVPWADLDLNIPPGQSDHIETVSATIQQASSSALPPQLKIRVWGAFPHMHTYGKSIDARFSNIVNGDTCLFDVPRWDFEWQQFFFYDYNKSVIVTPNDTLTLNCHYDTTGRNAGDPNITWGSGTADEMCLSFFYITTGVL